MSTKTFNAEHDKYENVGPHTHETLDYNFITADGVVSACSSEDSETVWKQKVHTELNLNIQLLLYTYF